jgi:hypothetical protein
MGDGSEAATAIDAATGQPGLPAHRDLQRLLDYWATVRATRAFPRRQDIDPVDLHFMLNRIALTEVHAADPAANGQDATPPRSYRFRLVGSWWRDITGLELTGWWASQLPDQRMIDITVNFYEAMLALRQPLFANRDAWIDDKRLHYQIMITPLSEDGERISMIMTGIGPRDA